MPSTLHLYTDLAAWWPLVSHPDDYANEADLIRFLLGDSDRRRSLLELGSGGGNTAGHLSADFDLTLVDRSPDMLDVSRERVPQAIHVEADMRSVRLDRTFDAVLVHDAVMYLTTEADLSACIETAAAHLAPGGAAVFLPDHTAETFRPGTLADGGDADDGRSLRFLEWTFDPDPDDTTVQVDFALLMRHPDGRVDCVHDRHQFGLFPQITWLRLLAGAGFEVHVETLQREEGEPGGIAFVARRY